MLNLITVILPIFGMMLIGFLAVALKLLDKTQLGALGAFVIKVALPSILLVNISAQEWANVWQPQYLISYAVVSLVMFIALLWLYRYQFNTPLHQSAVFAMGGSMSNTGFIGGATLHLILGPAAAVYFAMTFIVENFIVFLLFLVCLEMHGKSQSNVFKTVSTTIKSIFKNPIIIALCISVMMCLFQIQLPPIAKSILEPIGKATGPLGLFVIGGSLYGVKAFQHLSKDTVIITLSKMVIMPVLVYCVLSNMPNVSQEMLFAGVLLAGISMVTMFGIFGQQTGIAEQTSTTLLLCTLGNLIVVTTTMALLLPK